LTALERAMSTTIQPRTPRACIRPVSRAVQAVLLALALAAPAFAQDPDHDVPPETPPGAPPAEAAEPLDEAVQAEPEEGDAEVVRREGREAMEAARAYGEQERVEAIARARRSLATLDREAATLQARIDGGWAAMNQDMRVRAREAMRQVAARRADTAEWVGRMDQATGAAWVDVRDGFNRSYAELSQALRDARHEFGRPEPAPAPATDEDAPFEQDEPDYKESRDAPG
jgi:hypothetical protein